MKLFAGYFIYFIIQLVCFFLMKLFYIFTKKGVCIISTFFMSNFSLFLAWLNKTYSATWNTECCKYRFEQACSNCTSIIYEKFIIYKRVFFFEIRCIVFIFIFSKVCNSPFLRFLKCEQTVIDLTLYSF